MVGGGDALHTLHVFEPVLRSDFEHASLIDPSFECNYPEGWRTLGQMYHACALVYIWLFWF